MKIKRISFILLWAVFVVNSVAIANRKVDHARFYQNVAISQVKNYKNGNLVGYDVAINAIGPSVGVTKDGLLRVPMPTLGGIIWTITPALLPVTARLCNRNEIDLCNEIYARMYNGACYAPCITYGPEVISFDEKTNKLYLSAGTTAAGSGGGLYFTFVADIARKEIKLLLVRHGPFEGVLSPSGTYLLLSGYGVITIIQPETGAFFDVSVADTGSVVHERSHHLSHIHWLSDTQFSYHDKVRGRQFQGSLEETKENIYDIPRRAIIRTRTLN